MSACPFCGSEQTKIETPFVELNREGVYAPKQVFCCRSQEKNATYVKRRFDPTDPNKPDLEEVSKL